MADVTKLAALMNSYGIAVRAGAVTPCKEDEEYFRKLIGLPDMPESVSSDWDSSGGIRHPITLAGVNDNQGTQTALQQDANQDGNP